MVSFKLLTTYHLSLITKNMNLKHKLIKMTASATLFAFTFSSSMAYSDIPQTIFAPKPGTTTVRNLAAVWSKAASELRQFAAQYPSFRSELRQVLFLDPNKPLSQQLADQLADKLLLIVAQTTEHRGLLGEGSLDFQTIAWPDNLSAQLKDALLYGGVSSIESSDDSKKLTVFFRQGKELKVRVNGGTEITVPHLHFHVGNGLKSVSQNHHISHMLGEHKGVFPGPEIDSFMEYIRNGKLVLVDTIFAFPQDSEARETALELLRSELRAQQIQKFEFSSFITETADMKQYIDEIKAAISDYALNRARNSVFFVGPRGKKIRLQIFKVERKGGTNVLFYEVKRDNKDGEVIAHASGSVTEASTRKKALRKRTKTKNSPFPVADSSDPLGQPAQLPVSGLVNSNQAPVHVIPNLKKKGLDVYFPGHAEPQFAGSAHALATLLQTRGVQLAKGDHRSSVIPIVERDTLVTVEWPVRGDLATVAGQINRIFELNHNSNRKNRSELREKSISTTYMPSKEELKLLFDLLSQLEKPSESRDFPIAAVISDQHGTIDRFDALIVDAINQVLPGQLPADFKLNPSKALQDQLAVHGVTFDDLRRKIYLHNLGDLMDRGPYGVKVFHRSAELIDAGLSDFIPGNHDLWMFMNLQGFHLPFYEGYNFYGDREAEAIADRYRKEIPEAKAKTWWAEHLAEFTAFHEKRQKEFWDTLEIKVNGAWTDEKRKKRVEGSGLYKQVSASLNGDAEQIRLWNQFRGWYLVDIYTGVRAVGTVSIPWWEDLLEGFRKAYASIEAAQGFDAELPSNQAWREAIRMMSEDILPELKKDLQSFVDQGKDWAKVFEAVNRQNYTSPEWWAKDWVFHKDWGTAVIKELNENLPADAKVTSANYLENHTLDRIADFFKAQFHLYQRDAYQNIYMHAFLPVDMSTGEFYFTYRSKDDPSKKIEYRGKGSKEHPSVWQGLDIVAHDIRSNPSLSEIYEALNLVNSWYADNTTEIKVPNVAAAINKFGARRLAEVNGFNRLFTGHLPFHEFATKLNAEKRGVIGGFQIDSRIIFTDHGMGERFGGRGGWIGVSLRNGIQLRGFEHADSNQVVADARTVETKEGPSGLMEAVLFENKPISPESFAADLARNVEMRIAQLQSQVESSDRKAVYKEYLSRFSAEELKEMLQVMRSKFAELVSYLHENLATLSPEDQDFQVTEFIVINEHIALLEEAIKAAARSELRGNAAQSIRFSQLNLPVKLAGLLRTKGVTTVNVLTQMSATDLRQARFSVENIQEITAALDRHGLSLRRAKSTEPSNALAAKQSELRTGDTAGASIFSIGDIQRQVIWRLREISGLESDIPIDDDVRFEDLIENWDSLKTVEFVVSLEGDFDIRIPDEEAEKIQTVASAIEVIDQLLTTRSELRAVRHAQRGRGSDTAAYEAEMRERALNEAREHLQANPGTLASALITRFGLEPSDVLDLYRDREIPSLSRSELRINLSEDDFKGVPQSVHEFVDYAHELVGAGESEWVDVSDEDRLQEEQVEWGKTSRRYFKTNDGRYVAHSHPKDVARTANRTMVLTNDSNDKGPSNNWAMADGPEGKKQTILDLMKADGYKGKKMYKIAYLMSDPDSGVRRVGIQLTDSRYVALNMIKMARVGKIAIGKLALDAIKEGYVFERGIHVTGDLDKLAAERERKENPIDNRYFALVAHEALILSYGSEYGGNALFGKKFEALRQANYDALRKKNFLAEHMLIKVLINKKTGERIGILGAYPSAVGKTNSAFVEVPDALKEDWEVEFHGDDIAWIQGQAGIKLFDEGGQPIDPTYITPIRDLNMAELISEDGWPKAESPELGSFGVLVGTNNKSNPRIMKMIGPGSKTIFTNGAYRLDPETDTVVEQWWEGLEEDGKPKPIGQPNWYVWNGMSSTDPKRIDIALKAVPVKDLEKFWLSDKSDTIRAILEEFDLEKINKKEAKSRLIKLSPHINEDVAESLMKIYAAALQWAHPNSRFTVSIPDNAKDFLPENWGKPVSFQVVEWGVKLPKGGFFLRQAPDTATGILYGLMMISAATAAAAGTVGALTPSPFANGDFEAGDEIAHTNNMFEFFENQPKEVIFITHNVFKEGPDGKPEFPGFRENVRRDIWSSERVKDPRGTKNAKKWPMLIGFTPTVDGFRREGLDMTDEALAKLLDVSEQDLEWFTKEAIRWRQWLFEEKGVVHGKTRYERLHPKLRQKFDEIMNDWNSFQAQRAIEKLKIDSEALARAENAKRTPIIGGNWKMAVNDKISAQVLTEQIVVSLGNTQLENDPEIIIAPSFVHIDEVVREIKRLRETTIYPGSKQLTLGAQDLSAEEPGAQTSQISYAQLKDLGVQYVIIGHSERRHGNLKKAADHRLTESDPVVNDKVKIALKNGLKPILAIGELLEEREAFKTFGVIEKQILEGLKDVTAEQMANVVIAYEPVWAIGTGKTATPEQADEVQRYIRALVLSIYGEDVASKLRIQYGGSMNPKNAASLVAKKNIDGGLIGGASLKADEFTGIVKAANESVRSELQVELISGFGSEWKIQVRAGDKEFLAPVASFNPEVTARTVEANLRHIGLKGEVNGSKLKIAGSDQEIDFENLDQAVSDLRDVLNAVLNRSELRQQVDAQSLEVLKQNDPNLFKALTDAISDRPISDFHRRTLVGKELLRATGEVPQFVRETVEQLSRSELRAQKNSNDLFIKVLDELKNIRRVTVDKVILLASNLGYAINRREAVQLIHSIGFTVHQKGSQFYSRPDYGSRSELRTDSLESLTGRTKWLAISAFVAAGVLVFAFGPIVRSVGLKETFEGYFSEISFGQVAVGVIGVLGLAAAVIIRRIKSGTQDTNAGHSKASKTATAYSLEDMRALITQLVDHAERTTELALSKIDPEQTDWLERFQGFKNEYFKLARDYLNAAFRQDIEMDKIKKLGVDTYSIASAFATDFRQSGIQGEAFDLFQTVFGIILEIHHAIRYKFSKSKDSNGKDFFDFRQSASIYNDLKALLLADQPQKAAEARSELRMDLEDGDSHGLTSVELAAEHVRVRSKAYDAEDPADVQEISEMFDINPQEAREAINEGNQKSLDDAVSQSAADDESEELRSELRGVDDFARLNPVADQEKSLKRLSAVVQKSLSRIAAPRSELRAAVSEVLGLKASSVNGAEAQTALIALSGLFEYGPLIAVLQQNLSPSHVLIARPSTRSELRVIEEINAELIAAGFKPVPVAENDRRLMEILRETRSELRYALGTSRRDKGTAEMLFARGILQSPDDLITPTSRQFDLLTGLAGLTADIMNQYRSELRTSMAA